MSSNNLMRFIGFITVFLLFFASVPDGTSAEEILTWEDCLNEAKKNHPDLVSAEAKIDQAKANKTIASSNLLPQINGDMSFRALGSDNQRSDTYSYGITGRQLLFDGFKTFYDRGAASENIRSARYDYGVTSSDIRLRLRTAFVELLKAQELMKITEEIVRRRKQSVELVEVRYEAGREHKGSRLTAQANLAQAEFEVAQARRNIGLAQRRLAKELGRKNLTPIRVRGDFEVEYFEREKPDFESSAEHHPLLLGLAAQREAARLGLKSAWADYIPQLSVDANIGRTGSEWPPDQDEWSVGVNLSFPLFNGGRRMGEVSRNKALLSQVQANEQSARDGIILSLESAWTKLQDAAGNVIVQKKVLEAAEERAKIAEAKYSTGLISFDNWTIIEDDLVRSKKSFLDAQTNTLIAEANWIQAKGEY
ncbi:MAG: TolC family protein [Deltaproteobacteria bacterium]|nr:MAG: TolC family protein [Deltaproteobacteria bacterium]